MRNANGRFIRNQERINLIDFLSVLYRIFPLLFIFLILYSHFDVSNMVRKALVEFLCGKNLELCKIQKTENGEKTYWGN